MAWRIPSEAGRIQNTRSFCTLTNNDQVFLDRGRRGGGPSQGQRAEDQVKGNGRRIKSRATGGGPSQGQQRRRWRARWACGVQVKTWSFCTLTKTDQVFFGQEVGRQWRRGQSQGHGGKGGERGGRVVRGTKQEYKMKEPSLYTTVMP